jgi:hypothetical protein
VQFRAWNKDFYAALQEEYPELYRGVPYEKAFYEWVEGFKTSWPSLLTEPESQRAKSEDVKLRAIVAMLEVLLPQCDPDNKAAVITWACDNFNGLESLFTAPLVLDAENLANFVPDTPSIDPTEPTTPEPDPGQADKGGTQPRKDAVARLVSLTQRAKR